jgi:hypothetical protein
VDYSVLFVCQVTGLLGSAFVGGFAQVANTTAATTYDASKTSYRYAVTSLNQEFAQQLNGGFVVNIPAGQVLQLQVWTSFTGIAIGGTGVGVVGPQASMGNPNGATFNVMRIG